SKMRFVSVQFEALLGSDLGLRCARQANAVAARLARAVRDIPGVEITRPVEAHADFATLPADVADRVRERFPFHSWHHPTGEVRWMCAFDTTEADVDAFAAAIAEEMRR